MLTQCASLGLGLVRQAPRRQERAVVVVLRELRDRGAGSPAAKSRGNEIVKGGGVRQRNINAQLHGKVPGVTADQHRARR